VGVVGLQSADWIKCIGESQGPCLAISERNVSAPHQRQNFGGFDREDEKELVVRCDQNREITNQRLLWAPFICSLPLSVPILWSNSAIDGTSRDEFPWHDLTSLSYMHMQDCVTFPKGSIPILSSTISRSGRYQEEQEI
jgi:hypothetical protein